MITKIYFPIVNTDSLSYGSGMTLSNEEYEYMVNDNFQKNRAMMNDFYQHGFSVKSNNYYGVDSSFNEHRDYSHVSDCIEYSEAEALINDYNKSEINSEFFNNIINNQKMCILELNINPNSTDYDVSTEINLWIGESNKINNNLILDNKQKLSTLQGRDICVDVPNYNKIKLNNCKILKDNSTKNTPMNIIIIVEKITFA